MLWKGVATADNGDNVSATLLKSPAAIVQFVDGPRNPEQTLTKLIGGYSGRYDNSPRYKEEVEKAFEDNSLTALQTPMEAMQFTFLLAGVTRAFTHQLVRTRIGASYVQESMRFLGKKGDYEFLASGAILKDEELLQEYGQSLLRSVVTYEKLLQMGVASQDARGVLPTNILTSVYVTFTMKTLAHVYTQRFCCQAQEEWFMIVRDIKATLKHEYGYRIANLLSSPFERGESCGYGASFDRPCKWVKEN